jgi:hypothetical protein
MDQLPVLRSAAKTTDHPCPKTHRLGAAKKVAILGLTSARLCRQVFPYPFRVSEKTTSFESLDLFPWRANVRMIAIKWQHIAHLC